MKRSTILIVGGIAAITATALALPAIAARMPDKDGLPRSVRNNNPGNIIKTSIQWKGEVEGTDTQFETFSSADYGARAMIMNMKTHHSRGDNTITKMIAKWSATDVVFYTAFVAQLSGVKHNQVIQWSDGKWAKIAHAMSRFEAGGDYFPLSLFQKWHTTLQ